MPKGKMKLTRLQKLYKKSGGVCYLCKSSLEGEYKELMFWIYRHQHPQYLPHHKNDIFFPYFGVLHKRRKNIDLNIDHIIPVSKGGRTEESNLALVHTHCNLEKGSRDILMDMLPQTVASG